MKTIIILTTLILGILLAVFIPSFIKVRLECKSQFGACPSQINSKLQTLNSKSLVEVKREIKKVLIQDSQVSDFSTQFKLPNVIVVNIISLKPDFAVLDKSSGKVFLVDSGGKILGEDKDTPLPVVIQDGDKPNLFALNLIKGVNEMYGVHEGSISGNSLVIELPGPIKVIFPLENGDIQVLLGSLRLIYSKVLSEFPGKYSEIDLRFKNPVLR